MQAFRLSDESRYLDFKGDPLLPSYGAAARRLAVSKGLFTGTAVEGDEEVKNYCEGQDLKRKEGEKHGSAQAAGIFNFSPTTIRSSARLLADLRALTVVPQVLAMWLKVSPDFTR